MELSSLLRQISKLHILHQMPTSFARLPPRIGGTTVNPSLDSLPLSLLTKPRHGSQNVRARLANGQFKW